MSALVVCFGWEPGKQDRCHDEGGAVAEISGDQGPASTEAIDEHHAEELGDQGNDRVDGLVLQGILAGDTDLAVDLG